MFFGMGDSPYKYTFFRLPGFMPGILGALKQGVGHKGPLRLGCC